MQHCYNIFGLREPRVFDAACRAQVRKTGARVAGHEFGRPVAYLEFPSNQAWKSLEAVRLRHTFP